MPAFVAFPRRYKRTVKEKHSWFVVTGCWLVAILLSFIPMFGWYNQENLPTTNPVNATIVCRFVVVIPMPYLVYVNFFLCTLLPLLVMTVLYAAIFCTIRGSLREKRGHQVRNKSETYLRKEKQLAGSLSLVVVLFVISWFPLQVMNCVAYFAGPEVVTSKAFHVGILLSHSNSAVNPVVYAFKVEKIKRAYLKIWRQLITCRDENQAPQMFQSTDINVSSNANIGV